MTTETRQNTGQKSEGVTGLLSRNPSPNNWSGRPDSNRRRPAWEAGILPLNYGRSASLILLRWLLRVLQRHIEPLDHLVASRLPHEPLVDTVEIDLLVERDRRHLLDPELVDAM